MAKAPMPAPRKNTLLRIGVHECRTPLSVILGYISMLTAGRAGELTDMQRHMLGEMKKVAARMTDLVQEMADLSLLEAGSATFTKGAVDLGALLAEEIPNVDPAAEREVTIRVIDESPAVILNADRAMLRRAFNSLMFSSRRELVTSTELCVELNRVTDAHSPEVRVTIAGADRIEELRHLPESELDPLVEFRSGLGYGLSIARKVIEAHGGRTFSETQPGPDPDSPRVLGAVAILPEA
jgi:signal transduction histidine kinase